MTLLRRANVRSAVLLFAVVLASAYFAFLHRTIAEFPGARLEQVIQGTASTPFQYRLLVPLAIGWLHDLVQPVAAIPLSYCVFAIEWLEVLACFALMIQLARTLFGSIEGAYVACFALTVILFFNYVIGGYANWYYAPDIGAVLLTTACLWCLATGRPRLYYLVFAVAVLNRETIAFVTIAFLAFHWPRLSWTGRAAHLGGQAVLWGALKLMLLFVFLHNPGPGVVSLNVGDYADPLGAAGPSVRFWSNLAAFTSLGLVLRIASVFGFLWAPVIAFRRELRDPLIRSVWPMLPPYLLLQFVVGNIEELRIYNELVPFVALAVAEITTRRLRSMRNLAVERVDAMIL